RRYHEDRAQDPDANFEETFADMIARDDRDSSRADSPLAVAADAIVVDSTGLTIAEVFQKMMAAISQETANE
ncbi:MAG: Cytidylate kinase, partial [Pyrinomonadaceae bacterium]|nr:Cytidylate kinase [Pyrinomonadaceae bacterium]